MNGDEIPNVGDWIGVAPWKSRCLLLIHRLGSGHMTQAVSLADKRAMLGDHRGTIFAVWPGEWSTTCRAISTPSERRAVLEQVQA